MSDDSDSRHLLIVIILLIVALVGYILIAMPARHRAHEYVGDSVKQAGEDLKRTTEPQTQ